MDTQHNATIINEAAQTAHAWVNEIASGPDETTPQAAHHALRGVLFALRDRIMPEEAAHLGDQLPILIRGIYYEGYTLGGKPGAGAGPITSERNQQSD